MEIIQYKCLNCGGDLKFDPSSGKYTCEYCRSVFTQEELDRQTEEKTKQADSNDPPAVSDENEGEGKVYTCPSCGATIVTDATTAATFCYYCHNPVVLSGRLDGADTPDYVVPFKIDRKKALEIFEKWISGKKYIPEAFYSKDQIEKFTGVYFPYYLYSCDIDGDIEAEAAKENVSRMGSTEYTDHETYHVVRKGTMEVRYIMKNALKKANRVLAESVLPFKAEGLQKFNMSYLSGFMAEKWDIDKTELKPEIENSVREYAADRLKASLSEYDSVEITRDNTRIKNPDWKYALLPVWTLTYSDSGKIYYFSVNGQTGKTIGELPVDKAKLIKLFIVIFAAMTVILSAVMFFIF